MLYAFGDISVTGKIITPFVKIEVYQPLGDEKESSRWHVGMRHMWVVSEKISLSQEYDLAYILSDAGRFITKHHVGFSWKVLKMVSIDVVNDSYVPIGESNTIYKAEFIPGIGTTIDF
jgi:hypothetical protein